MSTPLPADIEASYIFACECQIAVSAFIEPDALQLFESVHRALRACPNSPSWIVMSRAGLNIAGLGRRVIGWNPVRTFEQTCVSASARERVCQTLERVLAWHARPSLTLNEIARLLGVGPRYLSEYINALSHRDFLKHLHVIRVLHAAASLADTNDTIESIARTVGYVCAPQLNKHYRRLLHTTPSRFRAVVKVNASLQDRMLPKRSCR